MNNDINTVLELQSKLSKDIRCSIKYFFKKNPCVGIEASILFISMNRVLAYFLNGLKKGQEEDFIYNVISHNLLSLCEHLEINYNTLIIKSNKLYKDNNKK
ncbi:MAG TPA: hypothetical protein VKR58_11900 [Aquella sp.]|nr:hypothetical protein [Aquella sp.]